MKYKGRNNFFHNFFRKIIEKKTYKQLMIYLMAENRKCICLRELIQYIDKLILLRFS